MRILVEFSEKQQAWHFNHGNDVPNSNSYCTVLECKREEAHLFVDIIEAIGKYKITEEWLLKFANAYAISRKNYKERKKIYKSAK